MAVSEADSCPVCRHRFYPEKPDKRGKVMGKKEIKTFQKAQEAEKEEEEGKVKTIR